MLQSGMMVKYTLSKQNAEEISRRRTDGASIRDRMRNDPPKWPAGAQAHIGNSVSEGQQFPMLVTQDWGSTSNSTGKNGQVFLDGNDVLWVSSVSVGEGPGTIQLDS